MSEAPKIERNVVNPVPDKERYGKPADLFPVWFSWNISIFGITCGIYVFGLGLSVWQAMAAGVIGYFASCALVGILAVGSVRTGLPTLVQSRFAFGYHGNKIPTFFGYVANMGWKVTMLSMATSTLADLVAHLMPVFSNGSGAPTEICTLLSFVVVIVLTMSGAIYGHQLILKVEKPIAWITGIMTLIYLFFFIPQINFSAYCGISNVTKTYDVLNVDQYRDLMNEINVGVNLPEGLKDETDWFDKTYRTGISQNYQVSVSNASDRMKYYLGAGYSDEQGIFRVAYNRRYNVKASFESDLFKWITVGANVAYSHYRNNGIISGTGSNRAGVVLSVINTPTYAKVWDETNPDWYWDDFYGANLTTPEENMARTENNYSETDRLLLTGYATIKFHKNLNFKSTVTMDRRWVHSFEFLDPIHTSYGRSQHGTASDTRSDDMRMVYDNILTYNNTWGGQAQFRGYGRNVRHDFEMGAAFRLEVLFLS